MESTKFSPEKLRLDSFPLFKALDNRQLAESAQPFGTDSLHPQLFVLSDSSKIYEYKSEQCRILVDQGEIVFVPATQDEKIESYGFSRCVGIAFRNEKGRFFAHSVENDVDEVLNVITQLQTQFPNSHFDIFLPLCNTSEENLLSKPSKLLTEKYVQDIQTRLPEAVVHTYNCTDYTPDVIDKKIANGGLPGTAIVFENDTVFSIETRIDEEGNVSIQR
ncbi:MAG: hypothetical protein CO030_01680 [Candidatus Magasanikbacteria bacterium CG_4_9_14_0_2_um_filter_42_11]|uniref:Uncharacterized protein n=1 Tax=Candidatus Magasanikbacteria bacterium CG_4_9_14_0_2_um_filter_42_11 TaxID=1974643 RepID=A0A2M8FAG5_9BACT|nr:MAG: hypothetical protein COU34_00220 [Candidatus Magasanikbacteria bacterium CG10_big_fil_rev_8_21_14_0_10_43_9]PIY92069.1 MAG: hypothetical protein COY70_05160 [Candidatus Magasanikbacteria bacterium CG_4_10_14_0_8_um_filter_42_12]PJC52659.1 MAG: hypothetical protein CO030_01680 [Candidatus Magasanikbacteria bacterium CG_4_9_14_0_2_um_filter_42_11]